jgi:hypothetical protein
LRARVRSIWPPGICTSTRPSPCPSPPSLDALHGIVDPAPQHLEHLRHAALAHGRARGARQLEA